MKQDDKKIMPRITFAAHRRVGLISLGLAVVGAGWLSSVVVPALQKSNRENGVVVGAFGVPLPGAKLGKSAPAPASAVASDVQKPEENLAEARFVGAPTGTAIQMVLAIARLSAQVAPTVQGTITFSMNGKPQEFWRVLPRVVGAAPAPGVQIAQQWDRYVILPRNMVFRRDDELIYAPAPSPAPVPMNPPHTTYRMAGYVELTAQKNNAPMRMALLETRIPGLAPVWRTVQVGEVLQRRSSQAIAEETRPEANIDVAPVVQSIASDAVVLRGGGDKTLRVPMNTVGVADIFDRTVDSIVTLPVPATVSEDAANNSSKGKTEP